MSLSTDIAEDKQVAGISAPQAAAAQKAVSETKRMSASEREDAEDAQNEDITLSRLLHNEKKLFLHELETYKKPFKDWRHSTIVALPAFMVNSSSNIIGATQLIGEGLMLKANGTDFYPAMSAATRANIDGNALKKAWYYVSTPIKSVGDSVFKKAPGAPKFNPKNLLSWDHWKDSGYALFNMEKATEIDSLGGKAMLINRWQARSTFAGLAGMTIAALMPDVKDKEEDIEKRVELLHRNPFGYAAKTIGEALWFPVGSVLSLARKAVTFGQDSGDEDVGKYKRQFTGLSLTIAGVCSFLAGFRNVSGQKLGQQNYRWNWAHSVGGFITGIAGSQLLLAVSSDTGWERFGATQWLRMAFLPKSIGNRYTPDKNGKLDAGRHYYFGGQAFLQGANTESFLFGGAQKLPDGTIIDNSQIREEAKEKAVLDKAARKKAREDRTDSYETTLADVQPVVPTTVVRHVASVSKAMPELAEAQREAAVAG
jgi:hypothetical protein